MSGHTPAADSQSAHDLERGGPSTAPPLQSPPASGTGGAPPAAASSRTPLLGAGRPLQGEQFRKALNWTGTITTSGMFGSKDSHPDLGLAGEVYRKKRHAVQMYHLTNWIINGLLITQAALSTVLVALGTSGNVYRVQIAVLGGVNGLTTGALSIIKGQGIPSRFWQYASGLRKVAAKIDELERRIEAGDTVTQGDLDLLLQMYEDVEEQRDQNVPDIWNASTDSAKKPRKEPEPVPTRPAEPGESTEHH